MAPIMTPQQFLQHLADTGLPDLARSLLPPPSPPLKGETAVVALQAPRTAALCFDRVWSVPLDDTNCPLEIRFSATSPAELVIALFFHATKSGDLLVEFDFKTFMEAVRAKDYKTILGHRDFGAAYFMMLMTALLADESGAAEHIVQSASRMLSDEISKELSSPVMPLYDTEAMRDAEYKLGTHNVVVAALRQLDLVDERSLSWEQVREFRQDAQARADYRRLVHWLDNDMVGRPAQFVIDEVGLRLESYTRAIRKHGLKTRLGLLASLLDAKALVSAAAAASGAVLVGQPLWGALAAGGVLLGKVLVTVGQSAVDLEEVRHEHREIAFVAEIADRFDNR